MKVLLLHFLDTSKPKHAEIIKNLEKAAVENGHTIDIYNGNKTNEQLYPALYGYFSIIVPASAFFGAKLPQKLLDFLAVNNSLGGKKGCGFVVKSGISSGKMCKILMSAMEKQGIMLDYFDILESPNHALVSGKKIG